MHFPVDRHFVKLYTFHVLKYILYIFYRYNVCFGIPNLYFCDNFECSIGFYYASVCHEFSFIMYALMYLFILLFSKNLFTCLSLFSYA